MPTTLSSIISILPKPFSPAKELDFLIISRGLKNSFPIATGNPFLNIISTSVGISGASG